MLTSKVTEKTGKVAAARIITDHDNDLMIISASGVVIRTDVSLIRCAGRATQGVTLMNLGEGDTVVAVATTNGKKVEAHNDEIAAEEEDPADSSELDAAHELNEINETGEDTAVDDAESEEE